MPDIYELYHAYLLARLRKAPGDPELKRLVAEHQRCTAIPETNHV